VPCGAAVRWSVSAEQSCAVRLRGEEEEKKKECRAVARGGRGGVPCGCEGGSLDVSAEEANKRRLEGLLELLDLWV